MTAATVVKSPCFNFMCQGEVRLDQVEIRDRVVYYAGTCERCDTRVRVSVLPGNRTPSTRARKSRD